MGEVGKARILTCLQICLDVTSAFNMVHTLQESIRF